MSDKRSAKSKKKPASRPAKPGRKPHSTRSPLPSQPNPTSKTGRPSVYCQALADTICLRLAEGESLRAICEGGNMPNLKTVLGWALDVDHPFYPQYARAREIQAEGRIDEIDDLAKSALSQLKLTEAGECVDPGAVQAIKLLIDTRKWSASKVLPKIYGDKLEVKTDTKFVPLTELAGRVASEPEEE